MADTIKTETALIEEGFPLQESVRFENEPWTSFYMAGETVRELRNGLERQARAGAESPEWPEDPCRDEEASSRMDDEGCPNEPDHLLFRSYSLSPFRGCCDASLKEKPTPAVGERS
jgi:hypothetical protein